MLDGDGTALNLYDQIEEALLNDWNNTARLPLVENLEFVDQYNNPLFLDCWVTPVLAQQKWDMEIYFDAYVAEQLEKDPNYNYNSDPDKLKWAEQFQIDQGNWFQSMYDNCWLACQAFVKDHPEYFWIRAAGASVSKMYEEEDESGWQIYTGTVAFGFTEQAKCDLETRVALQDQMVPVIDQLMADTKDMSALGKITYWDNWLANQNAYNHDILLSGIASDSLPWSSASGLLPEDAEDGLSLDPVCEGYAKALQLLCNKAEIPCVQISGDAGGDHMWLAIQMDDGKWYFCDPTWNDPTYITGNGAEEDRDYSTREYLLTVQPDSHVAEPDTLGVPTVSSAPYFVDIGTGSMFVVLYDENGKMLGMGFCSYISWGEEYLYYAPQNLSEELFAQATRIVRINVGGGDLVNAEETFNWSPLTALKAIKEAPEAE